MRVFVKSVLRDFWIKHNDCELQLKAWYSDAEKARWKTPHDIKKYDSGVSVIGNNRVVFNIKGNDYRLIVEINYPRAWVFVKFIGTHKQYDRINAETIEP
ncbi:MAG: type II toxin-antitoxin system HigB family toxin [Bacteroidota bacterium]